MNAYQLYFGLLNENFNHKLFIFSRTFTDNKNSDTNNPLRIINI